VHETSVIGDTGAEHGTHVISTIIGYNYYYSGDQSTAYALGIYPLPPIYVRGIAPDATIIPVKVLSDYHFTHSKYLPPEDSPAAVFGTENAVAAGINYATDLAIAGYKPMVISMSLGGPELTTVEKDAIDRAIANGVLVVAAAGNAGEEGMDYPGAYAPVISAGAAGWKYEWYWPGHTLPSNEPGFYRNRLWWLQYGTAYDDIPEPTPADEVYIASFSSRQLPGQDLDVIAPGSWVRGPYAGVPGYSHLPWWSNGMGATVGRNPGNFYFVGGTSMATPHVTSVVAMMLEKNPSLAQAQAENILESTALYIPPGSMSVFDLSPTPDFYNYSWGADATGSGLLQADAAVAAA
jgi:subtilisin family serine protease